MTAAPSRPLIYPFANSVTMRNPLLRPLSLFAILAVLAGATSGCGKAEAQQDAPPPPKPLVVETVAVTAVDAPQILRLTGTLRGAKETDLAANVAGRVQRTLAERGSEVKAGAILAQVDVSTAALALAEARVAVETSRTQQQISQAECDRYEKLKEKSAVSELEYDQVTAKCKTSPLNLQAAQARQTLAAKNVGDGVIRSPFAGVVTERYVEVGEYVQASSRVVSLAQIEELKLEFSVPEANIAQVQRGAPVTFRVVAFGDREFKGEVVHIGSAVRETRDLMVEAAVKNPEKVLLPGMFAGVELSIGKKSLPALPAAAVFEQNGKRNALVLVGGQLEQRVLQPLPALGDRVPVLDGVKLGERVVSPYSPDFTNGRQAIERKPAQH